MSGTTSSRAQRRSLRNAVEERVFALLRPLVILLLLIAAVFPFYYMLLLSFRPLDELLQHPGTLWISPSEVDLGTYGDVLRSIDDGGQGFLVFIRNSLAVALATVVATLLVSVPGAYAVSRLQFFGRGRTPSGRASSAAATSPGSSSPSTSSPRSSSPCRCSSSTHASVCAARSSAW